MPGWFIIAIIVLVIALIAVVVGLLMREPLAGAIAVVAGVLGLAFVIMSSFDIVATRNVGIVTTFGKPVDTRPNGIAWHAPWSKVSELPESIQLQSFDGDQAISVRLANNSQANVAENLNWRIREGAAGKLFQDYSNFDNIKTNLVDRQAQVALAKVFSTFNPQTTAPVVDPSAPPAAIPAPATGADLPGMANQVKKDLQEAVGNDIEILDVRIPAISYDQATQQRIDQYNQKVQETKNAQQDVATAHQLQLASAQRAAQAAPDLKVAIFNCINDQVNNGKDPAGCWGQVGGGSNQALINIPAPTP